MATATQAKAADLEVVGELPATPVRVVTGQVMAVVEALAETASTIDIVDADTAQLASTRLIEVAAVAKQIESARATVKAPFLTMCNLIDAAAKKPATALTTAGNALRSKLAGWDAECDRRAREAEAQRQAELKRIEDERLAAEKRKKDAEAAAAKLAPVDSDLGDFDVIDAQNTQASAAAESQRLADAAARLQQTRAIISPARPAGVNFRKVLKFEVVDVRDLPMSLTTITANEAAIRATYCIGWKEGQPVPNVPGIRFVVETDTRVNGRR